MHEQGEFRATAPRGGRVNSSSLYLRATKHTTLRADQEGGERNGRAKADRKGNARRDLWASDIWL
eukprot:2690365-Pyramimonas_sp.AAC.1